MLGYEVCLLVLFIYLSLVRREILFIYLVFG